MIIMMNIICNTDHYFTIAFSLHVREVKGQLESIPVQTVQLPGGVVEAAACLAICFDLPTLFYG